MKKILILFGLLVGFSFNPNSHAQIYLEADYCMDYITGCSAVVTKCRFEGTQYCVISGQIPCEEVCDPVLGG